MVGFGLSELDWGGDAAGADRGQAFSAARLDLALSRRRWEELTYEPSRAEGYLRAYRAMVEEFDPATARAGAGVLPGPDEAATASCVRHRVLDALPSWEGCVFCTAAA